MLAVTVMASPALYPLTSEYSVPGPDLTFITHDAYTVALIGVSVYEGCAGAGVGVGVEVAVGAGVGVAVGSGVGVAVGRTISSSDRSEVRT